MSKHWESLNAKQVAFKELFVGTLIYAVVLGFFNDYTSLVYAESFSTIFFAAIVLELLTFLVLRLKAFIVHKLRGKNGAVFRIATFFTLWGIMFVSKFIFVWIIDLLFGDAINIYGFFGILLVVLCVTVFQKLATIVFVKLGD